MVEATANREVNGARLDALVAESHKRYADSRPRSAAEHRRAQRSMPGGNTRSVLHFDPFPFKVESAFGAELLDIDGHRYIDFCGNFSAGLLGHTPVSIREALTERLDQGFAFGATHTLEADVAELICERYESIDQVRFTNSGTEANLMAIGAALHHTGRSTVGVFDQGYHGGVLAFGTTGQVHPLNAPYPFHVAPFDDLSGLDELFSEPDLGCVLVEVVQGSGGCRPASAGFLAALREHCDSHGVVLIFDEVMTSRLAAGGGQERFGIAADMTTLGKYLAGGLSFGAFGGRRAIMAAFDPVAGGALTQAGTFNNNVLSMTAAKATLTGELTGARLGDTNRRGDQLRTALNEVFLAGAVPLWATGMGSMLTVHADDDRLLDLLFHRTLDEGQFLARRGYMALSMEITDAHTAALVSTVASCIDELTAEDGPLAPR